MHEKFSHILGFTKGAGEMFPQVVAISEEYPDGHVIPILVGSLGGPPTEKELERYFGPRWVISRSPQFIVGLNRFHVKGIFWRNSTTVIVEFGYFPWTADPEKEGVIWWEPESRVRTFCLTSPEEARKLYYGITQHPN